MTDQELLEATFPPQRWAVEGLIPEGVTVLAGKAKSGKSWLLLDLAISVAEGLPVLDRFGVQQGDVLYLALEDSPTRMQARLKRLLHGKAPSGHLHIETDWPAADEGGIKELDRWLDDFPQARLVVVDVMRRFDRSGGSYTSDSLKMERLGDLGMKRHLGIIGAFHMYKGPGVSASSPDWMDKIQGSVGVSGAAQAVIGLSRARGSDDGLLRVTGKDVPEQDVPLKFDPEFGRWSVAEPAGEPESHPMSDQAAAILAAITDHPGATAPEAAKDLGETYNAVRHLMWAMAQRGDLVKSIGRYYTPVQAALASIEPEPQEQLAFGERTTISLVGTPR